MSEGLCITCRKASCRCEDMNTSGTDESTDKTNNNNQNNGGPGRNFGDDVTNTQPPGDEKTSKKRRSAPLNSGRSKRHKSCSLESAENNDPDSMQISEANEAPEQQYLAADQEDHQKGKSNACPGYVQVITQNLINAQEKHMLPVDWVRDVLSENPNYAKTGITGHVRLVMMGWVHKVWVQFDLKEEVLYCTASLLDRITSLYFGQNRAIEREKYQLYACACLWISCKYHEIYAPEMRDFVTISSHAFTIEDLKRTETEILCALDWVITTPTALTFARRFIRVAQPHMTGQRQERAVHVAMYFVENSVLDYKTLGYKPALIAAAAVSLGLMMTRSGKWCDDLVACSGYTEHDVAHSGDLLKQIRSYIMDPPHEHQTVRERYRSPERGSVSLLVPKKG